MKTCTVKQWESIKSLIDVNKQHFHEVKSVPSDAILVGYEQAAYGDWTYYVTKDGEFISSYYSIGD